MPLAFFIRRAGPADSGIISRLAYDTWPATYHFLPAGQVPYMLREMYSEEALVSQMQAGQEFLVLEHKGQAVGFASFSANSAQKIAKLNKLYVLPNYHGQGFGKLLLQEVEKLTAAAGAVSLYLNVNRHNPALAFYQRNGYSIARAEDIPIGPYFMNDYIMEKPLAALANPPKTNAAL